MNRRRFVMGSTAISALIGIPAVAQRRTTDPRSTTESISEATGAIINFADTNFELVHQKYHDETSNETIVLANDHAELTIIFVTPETYATVSEAVADYRAINQEQYSQVNEIGGEQSEKAAWLAARVDYDGRPAGIYYEFQGESFPGYHVVVELFDDPETIIDSFADVQKVDFAGAPPFVLLDQSEANTLSYGAFPIGGRTRRSSGNDRGTDHANQTASDTTTTQTPDGAVFVQTISDERSRILATIDEVEQAVLKDFYGAASLGVTTADEFIAYPEQAALLSVPSGYEQLGDAYLDWADALSTFGTAMFAFFEPIRTMTLQSEYQSQMQLQNYIVAIQDFYAADSKLETSIKKAA